MNTFDILEPVDRRSTTAVVAEAIRARIMDGSFEPGTQLTEAALADQLEVSRGPVREALQRLIQEGLLVSEPHRGVFVISLTADDVVDVYRARAAIERAAGRLLAHHADRETLRPLADLLKEMSAAAEVGTSSDVAEVDLRFHETLVAAAGSPRLDRMYATLIVETRLCLNALAASAPDWKAVVGEHRGLLRALRAGDAERVAGCIDEHLERAAEQLVAHRA